MRLRILIFLCLVGYINAQLPEYKVTMSPADYESLYTRSIWSDVYLNAVFNANDTIYPASKIRFKGHSTRYFPKKSYRIRMSTSQLYNGVRDLNFNAMYTDKSMIREKLAWDLFADLNAVAPFCFHAKLSINGNPKGLFVVLDKVDRYFLQNRGFNLGPLYEASDTYAKADLTPQPDSLLALYYDLGIGTSYSHLKELISILNNTPDENFEETVIHLFDTASVLNWFTVNTLTMMGDSYNKNYNLYRDTTRSVHQWIIIPWDYDLSFGRDGDPALPYPADLLNDGFAYTFEPLAGPSNVLKNRWMAIPSLREKFRLYLKKALDSLFTEERYHHKIDSIAAIIQTEVAKDNYKWGTLNEFYEHIEALKYYVTVRRNYLYKTFVNEPAGLYNTVTLPITQTGVPYHFVTCDGRTIATMWFTHCENLDSITIYAYPDSTPPCFVGLPQKKYIKRFIKIILHPENALFDAKLQFVYQDIYKNYTEVEKDIQDEHLLKVFYYNGNNIEILPGEINTYGNFITVDNINNTFVGWEKYFTAAIPESYTQKWYRQPNLFWHRIHDIKFLDSLKVYAIGEDGLFIKSFDGGITWSQKFIGVNFPFYKFSRPAINKLITVGDYGSIYKSSDDGENWEKILINTKKRLNSIRMLTQEVGYIVGDNGYFAITKDGGNYWTPEIIDSTLNFYDVECIPNGKIIIAGENGKIFISSDSGATFQTKSVGMNVKLNRVKHFAENTIVIVGDSGVVVYSTDGGNDWSLKNVPFHTRLYDLYIVDESSLYVAGENGKIFYTDDAGLNWYPQYTAISNDLYAIDFLHTDYGISAGNWGTILKTTEPATLTGIFGPAPALSSLPILYQNYPNPFNSFTTINYEIPYEGIVKLRIFNVLGQEIGSIVDEHQKPGSYSKTFDASRMASGVYFYRLSVGNNYSITKKFVIVK